MSIRSASIVTVSGDYNPKVHEVNVNGIKNMLEKAFEKKVKKFVYISSTSAIPSCRMGKSSARREDREDRPQCSQSINVAENEP